jgi:hypothetical protein
MSQMPVKGCSSQHQKHRSTNLKVIKIQRRPGTERNSGKPGVALPTIDTESSLPSSTEPTVTYQHQAAMGLQSAALNFATSTTIPGEFLYSVYAQCHNKIIYYHITLELRWHISESPCLTLQF